MKIRKIILVGIIAITTLALGTVVNAASTFNTTVTANKTEIKPGDEVVVTVGVSDINMGNDGINTLEGVLEYDTTLFEEVKSSAFQGTNPWTVQYNDESGNAKKGTFLAMTLSAGIKEKAEIFKVTLKAKKDIAKDTDTKISMKGITSNDGTDNINIGTKSADVKIKVETQTPTNPTTPSNPSTTTPSNSTTTQDETSKNTNKINTTVDKTQATNKIPKTGKSVAIMIILAVAILLLIGFGIKNKSMKDIK